MSVATTWANRIDMAGPARWNEELIHDGRARPRSRATKNAASAGRFVSALPVLFLLFDGVMKLINAAPVVEAQNQLGIPQNLTLSIGILELACVLIYAIPQTSILGAILLTGYLGGATAIQMRVANPLFTHLLFPAYVGVFLWGGLYIRDERLRRLLAFRKVAHVVDTPRESVRRLRSRSKQLNAALWIVQGLLAAVFLFAGSTKLILPIEVLTSMGSPNQIVLAGWFLRFIGIAEVLGAIGLILSRLLHIRPRLTPLAAMGLVIIMIGATSLTLAADGFITPSAHGGAIWIHPGATPEFQNMLRGELRRIPVKLQTADLRRGARLGVCLERIRERFAGKPHWYLLTLGVDRYEADTIAPALIAPVVSRADSEGVSCYLETFQEMDLPFYEEHGFQIEGSGHIAGSGPNFWIMMRAPRS